MNERPATLATALKSAKRTRVRCHCAWGYREKPSLAKLLAGLLCTFMLTGCGGGGSGSSATPAPAPSPPPPPPPVNSLPVANITASAVDGFTPFNVTFDGAGSTDDDGTITQYNWDFGDGTNASGVSVSHTFDQPGLYSVTLSVIDDDNQADDGVSGARAISIRARGAQLSGTIDILPSSVIDSDINDRFTFVTPNNSFSQAQQLGNPTRLGGYVNLPGTGSGDSGSNLFDSGDPGDFYAVNLTGSEIILLAIAETDADLDLRLWDSTEALVDASLGVGATESIRVTTPGDYVIEVFPVDEATNIAGGSSYVLNIGQDISINHREATRLSDSFVPGELLVTARSANVRSSIRANYGLRERGRAGRISLLGTTASTQPLIGVARSYGQPSGLPRHGRLDRDQQQRYETLLTIKALSRNADVVNAEPNLLRQPNLTPDDSFYSSQWHYAAINLPFAWDITTGASVGIDTVIVAVIDTGILPQHPDLSAKLVAGFDFISSAATARDGDGIDGDPTDEGDLAYGASSSFHGTHVAGTIAADSDNGIGVAGVSWEARIMPLRTLGVDGGTTFDVMQAMRYAAGLSNDSGGVPTQTADIINMSLGSSLFSQSEQDSINEVRSAGVIIIASAGNESSAQPSYPAAYAGVVSVSATTITDNIAPYSNFGASIDVAAPGGYNATDLNGDGIGDGVLSTLADDTNPDQLLIGYAALNGTSMAAPHVAGVAALMKAVHPGLTPTEFDNALMAGDLTDDLGALGRDDNYGFGLINAHKAVLTALDLAMNPGADPGPILTASASTLNFGAITSALSLTLQNIGTGSVVIDSVTSSEPWLMITADNTDPEGLGTYLLGVNRSGLADGSYTATAEFISASPAVNDISVTILAQVSSINPAADAGLHYVILVNAQGGSVLPAVVTTATSGAYTFSIADAPTGSYRVFAGTDMDDDGFLCDAGEACGAYRTLDDPVVLNINPSSQAVVTALDFVSEFRAVITGLTQSTASGGAVNQGFRYRTAGDPADTPQPQAEGAAGHEH